MIVYCVLFSISVYILIKSELENPDLNIMIIEPDTGDSPYY